MAKDSGGEKLNMLFNEVNVENKFIFYLYLIS